MGLAESRDEKSKEEEEEEEEEDVGGAWDTPSSHAGIRRKKQNKCLPNVTSV